MVLAGDNSNDGKVRPRLLIHNHNTCRIAFGRLDDSVETATLHGDWHGHVPLREENLPEVNEIAHGICFAITDSFLMNVVPPLQATITLILALKDGLGKH